MSLRWRIAGLVLAAVVFVATIGNPEGVPDYLAGFPVVIAAAIEALFMFVAVWFVEGWWDAARWVERRLFGDPTVNGGPKG